jgi:ABC-type Fe3+-siderophore transport system permease subunit
MMRAVIVAAFAVLVLAVVCMGLALVGRSGDWSPFALTMAGALCGLIFGASATIYLYVTDPDAPDPAALYEAGWRAGRAEATAQRRADR